jgi:hypothetical protein
MERNLDNLLKHEETWWAQRAKVNCYTVGTKISATFIRRPLKETGKTRLTSLTPSKATE